MPRDPLEPSRTFGPFSEFRSRPLLRNPATSTSNDHSGAYVYVAIYQDGYSTFRQAIMDSYPGTLTQTINVTNRSGAVTGFVYVFRIQKGFNSGTVSTKAYSIKGSVWSDSIRIKCASLTTFGATLRLNCFVRGESTTLLAKSLRQNRQRRGRWHSSVTLLRFQFLSRASYVRRAWHKKSLRKFVHHESE